VKNFAVYVLCRNRAALETVVLRAAERHGSALVKNCAVYVLRRK